MAERGSNLEPALAIEPARPECLMQVQEPCCGVLVENANIEMRRRIVPDVALIPEQAFTARPITPGLNRSQIKPSPSRTGGIEGGLDNVPGSEGDRRDPQVGHPVVVREQLSVGIPFRNIAGAGGGRPGGSVGLG